MNRREAITLIGSAAARPLAARAQQPERMRRIGVLMSTAADHSESKARWAAFLQRLQELALLWQIYSRCFSLQIHFLQRGHRCGGGRAMSSRMAWRTAGNVGRGGGPLILFFPPC